MAKFAPTGQAVEEIIESLKSAKKREEAYQLLELHEKVSGQTPVVWYPGIIGFGLYHYEYKSGHSGQAPILAFAPRQAKISLYIDQQLPGRTELLNRLGKHKAAVGCVYVNKLADIDLKVLEEILKMTVEKYGNEQGESKTSNKKV